FNLSANVDFPDPGPPAIPTINLLEVFTLIFERIVSEIYSKLFGIVINPSEEKTQAKASIPHKKFEV
ncbi:MAG: hypothetical protein QF447_07795, partial [Candidatus Thioglobus sp.]|nr:hypothetical protein [Candidatus Thioglobus sp.]